MASNSDWLIPGTHCLCSSSPLRWVKLRKTVGSLWQANKHIRAYIPYVFSNTTYKIKSLKAKTGGFHLQQMMIIL
jgi:hypothetical protein